MRQTRRGGPSRRWCVPTALTRDPDEQLEGDRILNELRGELGILVWRIARDVVLWAETPQAHRAGLFSPEAPARRSRRLLDLDLPERLAAAADTLASQLAVPEKADQAVLTWACRQAARWAADHGASGTAIYYAQAGALCSPEDAVPALETGRLALAAGQISRSESWLRRTVALARRGHQWEAYARACLALGDLYHGAERSSRARSWYRRAYGAARRAGCREVGALAAHGVFRLAVARGDAAEAAGFAALAERACAPGQPGTARILLQVARYQIDSGRAHCAQHPINRVLRIVDSLGEEEQLCAWSLAARAFAAGGQNAGRASRAWERAHLLISSAAPETAIRSSIDLACAASLLGDERRSNIARALALRVAPAHDYGRVRALLADIPVNAAGVEAS